MPNYYSGNAVDDFFRRGTEPVAARIARFSWITPNRLTLAGFVVGGLATPAAIFTLPLWIAGILFFVSDLFDYLDGDVARVQGSGSKEGAILDGVLDRYIDFAVIGAMTYLVADEALPLGLAALLGTTLVSFVGAVTGAQGKRSVGSIGDRGWRDRVLIVGLLLSQPVWTLGVIAVIANFGAAQRLVRGLIKE